MTKGLFQLLPPDILDLILYDLSLENLNSLAQCSSYFSYILFKAINRTRTQKLWEHFYMRDISSLRLLTLNDYRTRYQDVIIVFRKDPGSFVQMGCERLYERAWHLLRRTVNQDQVIFDKIMTMACHHCREDIVDRLLRENNYPLAQSYAMDALDKKNLPLLQVFNQRNLFPPMEQLSIAAACNDQGRAGLILQEEPQYNHLVKMALRVSINYGHLEMIKYLWTVSQNPQVDVPYLYFASSRDRVDIMTFFLQKDASNINASLEFAFLHNSLDVTRYLISRGAHLSDESHRRVCDQFGKQGSIETFKLYLEHYRDRLCLHSLILGSTACRRKDFFPVLLEVIRDPFYAKQRTPVEIALRITNLETSIITYWESLP